MTAEKQRLWNRRFELLYRIDLSALYHRKRERFFDLCDKTGKAIAVIGGSTAFAQTFGQAATMTVSATVGVTSAISLVASFSERARVHAELARKFCELSADLVRNGEFQFDEDVLNIIESRIKQLESNEPASLGALVRICQNEIASAQNQPAKVFRIALHQRVFAHLWDFSTPDWRADREASSHVQTPMDHEQTP